ncbi:MAG: hypothetical protein LBH27_01855 [Endomicrobium sp.]|jgi:F0F1-type ATP synthase delta subunit|nr:hypothetical protein [Endomicrobium sp.]
MKKLIIKKLSNSIIKYNYLSKNYLNWVLLNFSNTELRLFSNTLSNAIKHNNVIVRFSGKLNDIDRNKIKIIFKNKNILFKKNDSNIICGISFEYNDFILDFSVLGAVTKILNNIKENI